MDKKKKMEKYGKRSASVMFGVLTAFSAFGTAGISAEGTPSEVTRNESYTIEYGDMGGRTVVRTLHDDSGEEGYAYCTNPLEPNPPSGSVSTEPIEIISGDYSPSDAAKVLYYGFGGPGFDASLFPEEAYYGGGWNDDKYLGSQRTVLLSVHPAGYTGKDSGKARASLSLSCLHVELRIGISDSLRFHLRRQWKNQS